MKIPTLINRGRGGFNMTPMIDVVFLLIIFFLVASHLSDQDTQLEIELPTAESGSVTLEAVKRRITINVPQSGRVLLAGRNIAIDDLEEKFRQLKDEANSDLEIRIRGSRSVDYATVDPILNACAKAEIWNVSFAVYGRSNRNRSDDKTQRGVE
ncbi:biopolymer transporter ExbD [Pirellulaceae bacterium]|jgi:biopolymer transport protein ExbD|nr:biopolymer transporter ExbD [Pirellulaceae bacterium]